MSHDPQYRTLRESVAAMDKIIDSVATLLEVVADSDLPDLYDDHSLEGTIAKQNGARFAELLVKRMLFDDDIVLEYRGELPAEAQLGTPSSSFIDDGVDRSYLLDEVDVPREKTAAEERAEEIADADRYRIGDHVARRVDPKRKRTRGRIVGRDASDPTRLHVRFTSGGVAGNAVWVFARELVLFDDESPYEPMTYPVDDDPVEDPETDPEPTEPESEK